MAEPIYHRTTPEEHRRRKELAPGIHDAFTNFSKAVFADGALDEKTKQLIAVADEQHNAVACRIALLRLAVRVGGGVALRQPLAISLHRAALAGGLAASADGGPHVHHGLVVLGHPDARGEAGRQLPEIVLDLFLARPARQRGRRRAHAQETDHADAIGRGGQP